MSRTALIPAPEDARALTRVTAHATIAHHSKSFSLAAKILPPDCRDDAAVLYSYCRRVDDAVDEGDPRDRAAAVQALRAELDDLYLGRPPADPMLARLASIIEHQRIPRHYPAELLAGMAMDADGTRYDTLDVLVQYAYRVAGVVGLMMCHVLGVRDDRALMPAVHLGIAMQLTNICRDVGEDWRRGRLYLPTEILARHGGADLPRAAREGEPLPAAQRPALAATTRELLEIAQRYYRSADRGMSALRWRCALGVRAARALYAAIGARIAANEFDPLAARAFVPRPAKLRLLGAAALASLGELPRRLWSATRYLPPTTTLEDSPMSSDSSPAPSFTAAGPAPARRHPFWVYVGRIRQFDRGDWIVYLLWIGTMLGLVLSTGGFLIAGVRAGIRFPAEAWMIPSGALVFATAIAIDTIGHRTIYKEVLRGGEALVHHITIFCGVTSVVFLILALDVPSLWIPAMVLTVLSFVYSLVDEVFHWRRYITAASDPVEMWSHVGILIGHGVMMVGWWRFFSLGYPGVREALVALGLR